MSNRRERRAAASQAGQTKTRAEGTDPRLKGMETRHGGRTYELKVIINTGRSVEVMKEMALSLSKSEVIRGPDADQAIITLAQLEDDEAKEFWGVAYGAVERGVKNEN